MILGIHCSVREGFLAALQEASELGCEAMQMLPYRRNHETDPEEILAFRKARAASSVRRLTVHSRFAPCLASSDEARRRRSIDLLAGELRLAHAWGADNFVLHAGAYSPGAAAAEGIRLFGEAVGAAVSQAGVGLPVLLENVPGGGRRLGAALEQVAELFESASRAGVSMGVCLDTAHAWAAGYDVSSIEGMLKFLARVNRLFGAGAVGAFHLNDTRAKLGSSREHHGHWGQGYLGREGIKALLSRPEYAGTSALLETPKSAADDRRNLDFLRALS